jgi:sterol desaturase/sphingolipid hydroxylase (fatty acid hydroxylase superfamily)
MPFLAYTKDCLDAAQGKWPASGGFYDEAQPADRRRDRPKSIDVFENRVIEHVFARAHPITPIIWFGPFIAYGLYAGVRGAGALATIGMFLGGWLVWTLIEYILHRFLFHMSAHTPEQKFRAFMVHGYHHEFANDKMRLVAPPLMSWPIAIVVGTLYHYLFGGLGWTVFAGTCTGYVAYDWIHYYTHHFRPSNPVGKWLKSYHLLHHFDENHGRLRYGVSSPLWDFVFGTYLPLKKPAARS